MAGKRILIIDDSENIRDTLRLTLEFQEHNVDEAENGQQGVEMVSANEYDLVFCDLAMPGLTGDQVIRKIRRELQINELPIIVLSAEAREAKNRALTEGATDFIDKPFHPQQILETVEKYCAD